jgi:hypothetical protein
MLRQCFQHDLSFRFGGRLVVNKYLNQDDEIEHLYKREMVVLLTVVNVGGQIVVDDLGYIWNIKSTSLYCRINI